MRNLCRAAAVAAAVCLALVPAVASAKTPTQEAFHAAFVRMDAHWPNITSHDYWLALRDAEDLALKLSPSEKRADADVERDFKVFQVYRNCWIALVAKEKAISEFVIGQIVLQDDPNNFEAAREHFALAAAEWDEAFRLWPYMLKEKVRGDSPTARGDLVGTGFAWRAQAHKLLATTVR